MGRLLHLQRNRISCSIRPHTEAIRLPVLVDLHLRKACVYAQRLQLFVLPVASLVIMNTPPGFSTR